MAPGRVVIVANRRSGSGGGEGCEAALATLAAAGRPAELRAADDPAALPRIAAQAARDVLAEQGVLVAAGGDGTVGTVAGAALGAGCRFGVLPQGTFNYFARAHRLPAEPDAAAQVWLDGHETAVQAGLANGRPFFVNASLGLYPRLLRAREQDCRQYGRKRIVALWAALRTLLAERRTLRLRLAADGRRHEVRTTTLFVGNNPLQLEQFGFGEATSVERDGRLAAIVLLPVGLPQLLWLLLRGAAGGLGRAYAVRSQVFRHLDVVLPGRRAGEAVQLAQDGELLWTSTPIAFSVAAAPLRLLAPRA